MLIDLVPQRRDGALVLHRAGDVLTVNGTAYDFGPLPEGGTLPAEAVGCDWLVGELSRTGGRLRLALILPHGPEAPPQVLFPAPLDLEGDGPVTLPGIEALAAEETASPAEEDPA
jgi:hypothetical protein